MSEPLVSVTLFQDARDVQPQPTSLPYEGMEQLAAPLDPPVRVDLIEQVDRGRLFLNQLAERVIQGEPLPTDARSSWAADLEAAAQRARSEGADAAAIAEAVHQRRDAIADGLVRKAKLSLACWSPTIYKPGATRGADGVEAVTCLVLDYDDGTLPDEALAPWADWPTMLYSTWNHTDEHPRLRVVLVLDEPVPAHAWPRAWRWAWERSGGHIDPACKDPSRLYVLPAVKHRNAPYVRDVRDPGGALLRVDWERLPEPDPPLRAGPPQAIERVRLPPDQARQVARLRLREHRGVRERAAEVIGAKVGPRRADRIPCPKCGRPSVWFWLEPGVQSTVTCTHRNSCGWWGHLDELLDAAGGRHVA